jgi:ABC-type lipoprotein export system ATPase subunit
MSNMGKLLKVEGVTKSYRIEKITLRVLRGITFDVQPGEFLVIAGPSGAGKSTLLHILGALDPPEEGKVFFQGTEIYRLKPRERSRFRNRQIGFVFQFFHLLPEFSAWENVALPRLIRDGKKVLSRKKLRQRAFDLLRLVNLENRLDHSPSQLSGGEQQRVAIARALINRPRILLADEPTGNLDSQTSQNLLDLLLRLNRELEQTIIIVSHDQQVRDQAHRLIQIQDGKILDSQPA